MHGPGGVWGPGAMVDDQEGLLHPEGVLEVSRHLIWQRNENN